MIRNIAIIAAAAMMATPAARAETAAYTIDASHSSVAFKVRHMMVTDVRGSFGTFSGTIHLDAKNMEASSVEVTIDATSITTHNEKRDGHLKSPDFFDVAQFPTITFKSKKIVKKGEQWVAVGDFTMRGVTKEIELPFALTGPVAAGPKSLIGVSATTKINRQDYGVSWNKTLDAGGAVVGDQVSVELEIEAGK